LAIERLGTRRRRRAPTGGRRAGRHRRADGNGPPCV